MCERSPNCSSDDHCQLVLKNLDTGTRTVEYYCKAHLVDRVWEVERSQNLTAVEATPL